MSERQAIVTTTATLKCDVTGCGYQDEVGLRSVRQWVGVGCPRCGSVMVTEETAASVEAQLALIDAINAAVQIPDDAEMAPLAHVSVRTDTAGQIAEMSFKALAPDA